MEQVIVSQAQKFQCGVETNPAHPLHLHNEIELIYLCSGIIELRYGRTLYSMRTGDFALILPNTVHAIKCIEPARCFIMRGDKHEFVGLVEFFWHYRIEGSPITKIRNLHKEVEFCIAQLCNRKELWTENAITQSYLIIILHHLLSSVNVSKLSQETRAEWLGDALIYLNDHFRQTVTLDELSKELGVSKYHLSRNFNLRVGCSMTDYLKGLRVAKACRMLERREDSVATMAYECGFDSATTFFRAFKNVTGMTPHKYRKHFQANMVHTEKTDFIL